MTEVPLASPDVVAPGLTGPIQDAMVEAPTPDAASTGGGRVGWIAAVLAALFLVVGGGFFALRSLGAEGGADTPEAAVDQLFDALAAGDLVTVATLVEPAERRTLAEPAFDVIDELVRLNVLSPDIDVAALQGWDVEIIERPTLRPVQVTNDIFRVYVEGGEATSTLRLDELPLGSLITDRLSEDQLGFTTTSTESMDSNGVALAVVERDGRWFVSLWYSVAENARDLAGLSFPAAPLVPVGSGSPEAAVEAMIMSAVDADLEAVLTGLDPEEAAALYDYLPLVLDEATLAIDDALAIAREEGITWAVTDLELSSSVSGSDAMVFVDAMAGEIAGPDVDVRIAYTPNLISVEGTVDGESGAATISTDENNCTVVTYEFGGDADSYDTCADALLGVTPSWMATGTARMGIAAHQVDGEWYVSPTTTMAQAMLSSMRAVEPEDLEAIVDGFLVDVDEMIDELFGLATSGLMQDPFNQRIDPDVVYSGDATIDEAMIEELEDSLSLLDAVDETTGRTTELGAIARPVTIDGSVAENTSDQVEVDLIEGETITVELSSPDGEIDPYLLIFEPGRNLIRENDDFDGANAAIVLTAPSTGTYVIDISDLSYGAGSYRLTITPGDVLGESSDETASSFVTDDAVDGSTGTPGQAPSNDQSVGEVAMARAWWSDALFPAEVYRQLLIELGYKLAAPAELDPTDLYPAMAAGEIDLWADGWFPGHAQYLDMTRPDGSQIRDHVTTVGEVMAGGAPQGFVISKAFADEYGVRTLDDINNNVNGSLDAFDAADEIPGNGMADIYGCLETWTCDDMIDAQIAYAGWTNINQVQLEYDVAMAAAVRQANDGDPMVIYMWTPSIYNASLRAGENVYWLGMEQVLDDSNPLGAASGAELDQRPGTAFLGRDQCLYFNTDGLCQTGWLTIDIRAVANVDFLAANPMAAELLRVVRLPVIGVADATLALESGASAETLAAVWIDDNWATVEPWLIAARAAR